VLRGHRWCSAALLAVACLLVLAPNPSQAAQQEYCDMASPPEPLPLPLLTIRITPAAAAPYVSWITGGPRQAGTEPAPLVSARHVAILDDASGNLLYQQDAFTRAAPASITKIVTTIVAIERATDLQARITTSVSASAMAACDGSSIMGIEPGEDIALTTLLYGMMLPSGNDAAEQVAVSLAGSRNRYVDWMNERVVNLGLSDTRFVTPSGMDADDHYSSAYDMAVIGRDAMASPTFREIASTREIMAEGYYLRNLNPLLANYAGAEGIKIGWTDIAGGTIVASASRDGHRVEIAMLASQNVYGDAVALFEWVWRTFTW
jgi:D-alanyl-D-alanine carboxypeptidase (penicillin-binding protein 5/6)